MYSTKPNKEVKVKKQKKKKKGEANDFPLKRLEIGYDKVQGSKFIAI